MHNDYTNVHKIKTRQTQMTTNLIKSMFKPWRDHIDVGIKPTINTNVVIQIRRDIEIKMLVVDTTLDEVEANKWGGES